MSLHKPSLPDMCCRTPAVLSTKAVVLKLLFLRHGASFDEDARLAHRVNFNRTTQNAAVVFRTGEKKHAAYFSRSHNPLLLVKTRRLCIESPRTTVHDTWPLFPAGRTTCAISPLKHPFRQALSYSHCTSHMLSYSSCSSDKCCRFKSRSFFG